MPLILGTNSIKDTGYDVANSCRFFNNTQLKRTNGSPTNAYKGTFSAWVKRSALSSTRLFQNMVDGNNYAWLAFNSSHQLEVVCAVSGSTYCDYKTNRLFRDVSAWYHIVVEMDTTEGTATNRMKFYVNGVQETSFATQTFNGGQNSNHPLLIASTTNYHTIGASEANTLNLDGYMTEVVLLDGQALDPTSFGEFDEDSGIWKPIDVSGLTFGTNGFYLDFENSGSLGADVSGNGNNFTVNNLTSIDQSTDTCTLNYATKNPLYKQDHAFSDGNLTYTSSASDWDSAPSTFGASSGKWYVEAKVTALGGGVTRTTLGICDERDANEVAESEFGLASYNNGDTVGYYGASANQVYKNGSVQSGTWSAFTTNDIIGMYVDLDNGYVYFSKNGSMQNSGDPTSGSSGTGGISITTGATYLFGLTGYGGGASQINFGSPPFSISSGNSDPNGYGNFEYSTQNYYALNTKNLAEYG